MSLRFPSLEFDDAVAAVCHGQASDEQMRSLNGLLRSNSAARDEYLLRMELHARLASDADLFAAAFGDAVNLDVQTHDRARRPNPMPISQSRIAQRRAVRWVVALATCLVILVTAAVYWLRPANPQMTSSLAVAVLSQAVAPRWSSGVESHSVGAALEPGWLHLKSGLVQVTFYHGARLIVQGPAEVQLVSPSEAFCQTGRVVAVVPTQGRGFRIGTPQVVVTDLGTEFGLKVTRDSTEVDVLRGEVEYQPESAAHQNLQQGKAVVVDERGATREVTADPASFAPLYDLERKWLASLTQRYKDWHTASTRLNQDRSLLVHFDFEEVSPTSAWTPRNRAAAGSGTPDATVVGCQATEGRWPGKRALEFRNMNDRVLLAVPGEFQALTLSVWVNVTGLDRQFNSLLMCDGFFPGTLHWQIRNNGVLDLGVQGPRLSDLQIFTSPPVIGFNQFGRWLHLAVVVDGTRRKVTHYINGSAVSQHELDLAPPYRIGAAELGNWNPGDFPHKPPFLIRHFSGAMDEFALFHRAFSDAEIRVLYTEGKPQPDL